MGRLEVKVQVAETEWNCWAIRLGTLVPGKSLKYKSDLFPSKMFAGFYRPSEPGALVGCG